MLVFRIARDTEARKSHPERMWPLEAGQEHVFCGFPSSGSLLYEANHWHGCVVVPSDAVEIIERLGDHYDHCPYIPGQRPGLWWRGRMTRDCEAPKFNRDHIYALKEGMEITGGGYDDGCPVYWEPASWEGIYEVARDDVELIERIYDGDYYPQWDDPPRTIDGISWR